MGGLLKEAIDSVWASEHRPDEVLLINDGSKGEETLVTIQELEEQASIRDLPLKVIHKSNRGLAAARNTGLEAATGEFISFLDGDDIIEPAFYRVALQLLIKHLHLGGVAAWATIFGDGIPNGFWNAPQAEFPSLLIENSVIVPCVTRTAVLRHLSGYDTRQRYNYEDWELSIRLLASGYPIITVPAHLMRYRVRRDSLYRSMNPIQNQVMRELMLEKHQKLTSQFALEIAMQLEEQWKQLAYVDRPSSSQAFPTQETNSLYVSVREIISQLLPTVQRIFRCF
jgi:glycosyltransferase involved in cell wall biosynthesis